MPIGRVSLHEPGNGSLAEAYPLARIVAVLIESHCGAQDVHPLSRRVSQSWMVTMRLAFGGHAHASNTKGAGTTMRLTLEYLETKEPEQDLVVPAPFVFAHAAADTTPPPLL
jgi:hypothetical protein